MTGIFVSSNAMANAPIPCTGNRQRRVDVLFEYPQMFHDCKICAAYGKKGRASSRPPRPSPSASRVQWWTTARPREPILSFTKSLVQQLMPKGVRVNAVAPSPAQPRPANRPTEGTEGFGKGSGCGRPGLPSEVAPSFVFLASADATLYTGQVLRAYPLGD